MHYLKWCIVHEKQQSRSLELCYTLFAWAFPALISCIPIITESYGKAGGWCWIPVEHKVKNSVLQFFEGFGIALFVISFNVYNLLEINKKLRKDTLNDVENEGIRKKLMKRMIYYPLVIGICILPAAVNRVANFFIGRNMILEIIAADAQCLMGFGNCIVYGFTDNLKKRLKIRFKSLLEIKKTVE